MEFVEAQKPRLLRDRSGGQGDRIFPIGFAQFRFLPQRIDALVHIGHEFMEMHAALAHDRRRREEQIHQHGLAAADLTEDVETPDVLGRARAGAEQPAERRRLAREPMLGNPLFESRQVRDDGLLGAVAFDLAGGNARRVLHRNGGRHAGMDGHGWWRRM